MRVFLYEGRPGQKITTGGRIEGRTGGRIEGRIEGRTGGRIEGRTGGRTADRTGRRTGGRIGGRTGGRTGSSNCLRCVLPFSFSFLGVKHGLSKTVQTFEPNGVQVR